MSRARDRFLTFVQRVALVAPTLTACSAGTAGTAQTAQPIPTASTSASATASAPPPKDVTAGTGPCRCSWDTNAAAAPRVCKKGEVNYAGTACIPGSPPPFDDEALPVGPLPPPDLERESLLA